MALLSKKTNAGENNHNMDAAENNVKKHLLIVEDNEVLCHFLQKSLQCEGYTVDTLLSGELIPQVMERNHIHLLVLDILLPGKDGLYWLKWMKHFYPGIPVVIISSKAQSDERLQGLEAGASDYLTKPFHDKELRIKINHLIGHPNDQSQEHILHMGDITVDTVENTVYKNGNTIPLTGLECKILQLFYINIGIPLSRDEIMLQTMGVPYIPFNRSIDIHINRIRKKVEDIPSKPSYICTVRGKGYCLYLPE